jgi:SIR2-like domain
MPDSRLAVKISWTVCVQSTLRSQRTLSQKKQLTQSWLDFMAKVQIQTGTLLKTDSVSFLLGAGASKECGGVLIGKVPLDVERTLLKDGVSGTTNHRVRRWVLPFYQAAALAKGNAQSIFPMNRQEILDRHADVTGGVPTGELPVNLESLLSLLWRWRAALPEAGGRIQLDGTSVDLRAEDLDECLLRTTRALATQCRLPREDVGESGFEAYKHLLRKVLTRQLNLKRVNIFTLNYDTLVEQASDAEGVVLVDGFVGTVKRVFRPESYDHDLYFPAETTEGRVHRFDKVAHLYKLHGSVTWGTAPPDWDNPYGVAAVTDGATDEVPALIYPTPAKIGETLGMPYAELFRRFAAAVVRPQSTLFVLGYGFGDDHVNAIIRQALTVPSFTLVIVDPNPISDFVGTLKRARDRRVWILSGATFGTFGGFVERVLPDLRDEDVRRKIAATWRALRSDRADAVAEVAETVDD